MRDAGRFQLLAGCEIKIRGGFFVRDEMRVIARAAGDHLAAQARVFVHLEHIDADVRRAGRQRLRERLLPAFRGLVRKPCDQIDIEVRDARRAQARHIFENGGALVHPPDSRRLAIHERLHAQADAVHATR